MQKMLVYCMAYCFYWCFLYESVIWLVLTIKAKAEVISKYLEVQILYVGNSCRIMLVCCFRVYGQGATLLNEVSSSNLGNIVGWPMLLGLSLIVVIIGHTNQENGNRKRSI